MSFDRQVDDALAREQRAIDSAKDRDEYIPGFFRVQYHPDTHEMIGVRAVRKEQE